MAEQATSTGIMLGQTTVVKYRWILNDECGQLYRTSECEKDS
jgi:hypothetical protein